MSSIIDGVRNTIVENFAGGDKFAKAENQFSFDDVPSQSGKVAVVTGGSEGIGFGVVYGLLNKDISKVYVLSGREEVIDGAKDSIAKELGQDKADRIKWLQCDLANWSKVAELAKEISESTDRLDILVNNAAKGIMSYELTDYGVDRHLAVNHIGHAVLTSSLLPLLKKTAAKGHKVRISNQSSNAHQGAPSDTKFANLEELNQDRGANGLYGRSKLAGILYAKYLARHLTSRHPNILANATHPGFVQTKQSTVDIHEPYPIIGYGMSVGMVPFKKSLYEGALPTLFVTTVTEKSGEYVCVPAIVEEGSKMANDAALGEQLMKLTVELVKEKAGMTLETY